MRFFFGPGPEPTPSWRLRRSGAKIKGRRGSALDGCTFAGPERENKKVFFFGRHAVNGGGNTAWLAKLGGGGNNSSRHLGDKLEQKKARECTSPSSSYCFFLSLKKRLVAGQMFGTPLLLPPTAEPAVLNGLYSLLPKPQKKVSTLLTRVISLLLLILSLKCSFARRRLILYPRGLSTRGKDAQTYGQWKKKKRCFFFSTLLRGMVSCCSREGLWGKKNPQIRLDGCQVRVPLT